MSDQPDKPEDGNSASADASMPEPELVQADDVQLADPDVSTDAVEPTLNTSAEDVRLTEPSLGAAEISEDAAEAASLKDAAAEAAKVAKEAEDVGTLVAGPRPAEDPAEAAAPAGTAPAGGAAGDAPDIPAGVGKEAPAPIAADDGNIPADDGPPAGLASFAASGTEPAWTGQGRDEARWDALFDGEQADATAAGSATAAGNTAANRATEAETESPETTGASADSATPEAPWAQPFAGGHPQAPGSPVPPVGGPYGLPPAGGDDPAPTRIRARSAGSSSRGGNRRKLIILAIAGLVVLALLIFAITNIVNAMAANDSDAGTSASTTPGADGIIAEGIPLLELGAGDCILGFDSTDLSADVTTVTCTTPHNAQLLATTAFPEDAEFPGEAALNASGDELCNSVAIDENAAAEYAGLTLTQVTPTSGTWADGDRRIDCFVVSDEGNVITDTLLAE